MRHIAQQKCLSSKAQGRVWKASLNSAEELHACRALIENGEKQLLGTRKSGNSIHPYMKPFKVKDFKGLGGSISEVSL